jgi:hypothetical protein
MHLYSSVSACSIIENIGQQLDKTVLRAMLCFYNQRISVDRNLIIKVLYYIIH